MKAILIAAVAYAVNAAYALSLGDESLPVWSEAPQEHRDRMLAGVQMHIDNPDTTPEQAHAKWLESMTAQGWTYGEVKDVEAKKHPCILPFNELPQAQRSKDSIFRAVVHALKDLPDNVGDVAVRADAAPSAVAAPVAPIVGASLAIQYIGRRQEWSDRVYNTGLTFVANQARVLPEQIARQLLRHPDLFKVVDLPAAASPAPAGEPAKPADDTADLLAQAKQQAGDKLNQQKLVQDLYDQVDRMDKDGLYDFAFNRYSQKLNKQAKVETLRAKVRGFIDQFGVV